MKFTLPYPPSVNHIWRRVGNRTLLSRHGRRYREEVASAVAYQVMCKHGRFDGRLQVTIEVYPPDHRRRDLDNVSKAALDALQSAGIYRDDSQIDDLRIIRGELKPGGRLIVTLETLK